MTEQPISPQGPASPREEKLKAIAAVFGEAVAHRLATSAPQTAPRRAGDAAIDADRVAWQTNRLIQHLRSRTTSASAKAHLPSPEPASLQAPPQHRRQTPRLPPLSAGEDLAGEHPAVIAHMLRDAPQELRVAVLRALPGQIARAVMRRLKAA